MFGSGVMRLHDGQAEVWCHPARFKVVTAGRRWGKSQLSKSTLIEASCSHPHKKVWYIAPTYRMAKQIMWDELLSSIPKRAISRIHHTDLSIRLINNSLIECKGADNPDTLRGVGLDYVVLDEYQDMKEDTWTKVIRPTLAQSQGRALFIGTPKGYQLLYDLHVLGQDAKNKAWKSWQFPTSMSPFIPSNELQAAREDMDEKSYRQEFEASFETMSGRVYYPFDRFKHVGDYPFNPRLPIWIGQDFNVDPMCTVIMQKQDNGEVWVVDEIYQNNSSTELICKELERRYWRSTDKAVVYPDPAGKGRSSARGESDLDIFRQKGFRHIKYKRKHPPVADRINAVNRMLMDAAGNIRLRFNKTCTHIIESLEQTLYRSGSREVDKAAGKEHMADALGYCIELEFPTRKVEILGKSL